MESSTRAQPKAPRDLYLDEALALLRYSSRADPIEDAPDDAARMQRIIDGLCELSQRDGLTGLANADHFRRTLDRELERVVRMGEGVSILLLGVDHLSRVAESGARWATDTVLRAIAATLSRSVRRMDFVARLGNEDFAVMVPAVAPQHIRGIAERLRTVIARTPVLLSEEATVRVTASVGGASASPWRRMRAATLLAAADRQLMAARSRRKDHIAIDALPSMRVSLEERALLFGDSEGG